MNDCITHHDPTCRNHAPTGKTARLFVRCGGVLCNHANCRVVFRLVKGQKQTTPLGRDPIQTARVFGPVAGVILLWLVRGGKRAVLLSFDSILR